MAHPKMTTEQFIQKSIKIHGKLYDYSDVKYENYKINKVIIHCSEHGQFEQTPVSHLQGSGCQKCARTDFTTSSFINMSEKVHSRIYDYSETNYEKQTIKVKIICKLHGVFMQNPFHHLKGSGCPHCSKNAKLSTVEFIHRAKEVHGNLYDYSKSKYINGSSPIKIKCNKHGMFLANYINHVHGKTGCPRCKNSKGENKILKLLESINVNYIREHTFADCKNIRKLKFDFYLPKYDTCIEFDGQQHFSNRWSKILLRQIKRNDRIKNNYCKNNNIKLIRIKFDDLNYETKIKNNLPS